MIPANYLQCNEEGEGGEILFPLHEAAKRGNVEWVCSHGLKSLFLFLFLG